MIFFIDNQIPEIIMLSVGRVIGDILRGDEMLKALIKFMIRLDKTLTPKRTYRKKYW